MKGSGEMLDETNNRLESFIYTAKAFENLIQNFPIKTKQVTDMVTVSESSYSAVYVHLMIARKYFTTVSKKQVYIPEVIKDACIAFPSSKVALDELIERYQKLESKKIELLLSNGKRLSLQEIVEHIIYGMYLHADIEKIEQLTRANEFQLIYAAYEFLMPLEEIVKDLLVLIEREEKMAEEESVPILLIGEDTQSRPNSPKWKHLNAIAVNDKAIFDNLPNSQTDEESYIFQLTCAFTAALDDIEANRVGLGLMVTPRTRDNWGDFSEARDFLNSIADYGLASKIHFNEEHSLATANLLSGVTENMKIEADQLIGAAAVITLVKEQTEVTEWSIFSIGDSVNPHETEGEI